MMPLVFSWLSFKLLYQESYQLLLLQSALYINQYRKQSERITSLDLVEDQKSKDSCILRFHDIPQSALLKEATNYLFHRTSCTQVSIAKKKCTMPFSIKFSNARLENNKLFFYLTFRQRALRKNLTAASFLEHPVHSPVQQTGSIKHIS